MKKVKQIYLTEKEVGYAGTGLILELEDGTFLAHYSTDPIKPFEKIDPDLLSPTPIKSS